MADLAGVNGQRKEFKVVGKPNLPGKLSYSLATGKAKFGIDYVFPEHASRQISPKPLCECGGEERRCCRSKKDPRRRRRCYLGRRGLKNLSSGGDGGILMGPTQAYLDNQADQEDDEVAVSSLRKAKNICDEALRALNPAMGSAASCRGHARRKKAGRARHPAVPAGKGGGGGFGMGGGNNPPRKATLTIPTRIMAMLKPVSRKRIKSSNMTSTCLLLRSYSQSLGSVACWFDDPMHGKGKNLHIEGVPWGKTRWRHVRASSEKVKQEGLFQGGKYCDWGIRKTQEITPLLAKRTGRPVRMRQQPRRDVRLQYEPALLHLKVGFKNNGLITAIDDFSIADAGVRGVPCFGNTRDQSYGPYFTTRCLNIKQIMEVVNSNTGKDVHQRPALPF